MIQCQYNGYSTPSKIFLYSIRNLAKVNCTGNRVCFPQNRGWYFCDGFVSLRSNSRRGTNGALRLNIGRTFNLIPANTCTSKGFSCVGHLCVCWLMVLGHLWPQQMNSCHHKSLIASKTMASCTVDWHSKNLFKVSLRNQRVTVSLYTKPGKNYKCLLATTVT